MPDYFNLPDNAVNQQAFNYTGDMAPWYKPSGITMIHLLVIASGGGGGGGLTGLTSTTRGGGGGGSCGNLSSLVVPAMFVPDVLWVNVGPGGTGGAAGIAGNSGTGTTICHSYVDTNAALTNPAVLLSSGTGTVGGGAPGLTTNTGASSVPGAASITQCPGAAAGSFSSAPGIAGSAGSVTAGSSPGSGFLVCPGSGGGGATSSNTDNVGGPSPTGSATTPWLQATVLGGVVGGGKGPDGWAIRTPMFFFGGLGGGSNAAGTGGAGGNGSIGSGGGGGGGGITGGPGGNGGNGLAMITCW